MRGNFVRFFLILCLVVVGCQAAQAPDAPPARALKGVPQTSQPNPAVCACSPPEETGYPFPGACEISGDLDGDCVCSAEDTCPGTPDCTNADTDSDGFGNACDIMPNTPDPEGTLAAMTARVAAMESSAAMYTAALVELRSKYPAHFHGLLGLNGEPVGDSGDLSYSLPGDE